MSEPSEATPRPWRVAPREGIGVIQIHAENGPITVCPAEVLGGPSDAALIVRAVNNHAPLVEALREMVDAAGKPSLSTLMRAAKALGAAESETP